MNSERGVHRERGDVFTGERVRPICLAKGRVEALRAKNAALANTQKELDGYLETKRVIFPRFYFLTNEEIVLFLASVRAPEELAALVVKCFDGLASLKLNAPTEDALTNPVNYEFFPKITN